MKAFRFLLLIALCACLPAEAQKLTGDWQGQLDAGRASLRIVLHFTHENGVYKGTMDSPDQGALGVPMEQVLLKDKDVSLSVPSAQLKFAGTLQSDSILTGSIMQRQAVIPITLKRIDWKKLRPQTPCEPFPYQTEEVVIKNPKDGVSLAGTLTLPQGKKRCRAVILLTGSGAQDRDESLFNHKPFWVIADYLTRRGFAVLRCDDRGVGQSTGDANLATTATGASDAEAMIDYLKTRREINPKKIGLLGHSEGGPIAFITAATRKEVDFVISMAGPGVKGDSVMLKQNLDMMRLEGYPEQKIESFRKLWKEIYAVAETDLPDEEVLNQVVNIYEKHLYPTRPMSEGEREQIRRQMTTFTAPWIRFFLRYDPQTDLKKLKCHIMAINGNKDSQVDATTNLEAIRTATAPLKGRQVNIKLYPELNHLFQHCQTGLFTEYESIKETISLEVLEDITVWLEGLK